MRMLSFDPADHVTAYRDDGYVHIPGGMAAEFHAAVAEYAERELGSHLLDGLAIKGKKEQALYELPPSLDLDEVLDAVAVICGLDRSALTLSERHINAYDSHADPEPPAHKDRFASQVSVGFSIRIPEASCVVLYPRSHRETNPFNTSAGLRRHLQPDELPEVVLRDAFEVELHDRDGDVMLFPGSSTWHLRRRSEGAVNLYLKFNDLGCDPLGEDPRSQQRRQGTLAILDGGDRSRLDAAIAVLAGRFDGLSRTQTRDGFREVLELRLFGEEPAGLTELQLELLRRADGILSVGGLAARFAPEAGADAVRSELLRLARIGAIDLV